MRRRHSIGVPLAGIKSDLSGRRWTECHEKVFAFGSVVILESTKCLIHDQADMIRMQEERTVLHQFLRSNWGLPQSAMSLHRQQVRTYRMSQRGCRCARQPIPRSVRPQVFHACVQGRQFPSSRMLQTTRQGHGRVNESALRIFRHAGQCCRLVISSSCGISIFWFASVRSIDGRRGNLGVTSEKSTRKKNKSAKNGTLFHFEGSFFVLF